MNQTKLFLMLLITIVGAKAVGQNITVKSPDNNIVIIINNDEKLSYSVSFHDRSIVNSSQLGFELKDEPAMTGNFAIQDQSLKNFNEKWIPVVKSKHSEILNNYNELLLSLREKSGPMRQLGMEIRAYNDGVAFRYKLLRAAKAGDRQITKELSFLSIH